VVSNGSACLRWLAGDAPNIEEAREAARRIVRDGKRAAEIIARIRSLTKRTAAHQEKLDLNVIIREVLPLFGDEAKKKSVMIRTCFAEEVLPVLGDRVQLQQVVLNLVMNGIEAMSSITDRSRELLITSRNNDQDQVEVMIEDSGIGLGPDQNARIFDAFYTTKPSGMGMGLSICRSILQAHGGQLWATGNDGPGSTFHFSLPKGRDEANAELEPA
jgi:signal transduction histidine kinase